MMANLVVSQEGLRNYILEGVENLRIRKCRPDRETIAHYVLRKYGGSLNDIFTELENIVDEGLLLKVEYKGSTSYRTPQSFDQKNSPLLTKHSKILNSTRTTRLILATINDLLTQKPEYCSSGIPLAELKTKLQEQEPVRFADDKVDIAFGREVSIGNVLLGEGARVYPKDIQPKKFQTNGSQTGLSGCKSSDVTNQTKQDAKVPKKRGRKSNAEKAAIAAAAAGTDVPGNPPVVTAETKVDSGEAKIEEKVAEAVRKTFDGRVSGRNKIKRKVFDPSDVPTLSAAAKAIVSGQGKKKKRNSGTRDTDENCDACGENTTGSLKVVSCSSCKATNHESCAGIETAEENSDAKHWLCGKCQTCNACACAIKGFDHVECIKCKSNFHTACVGDGADFTCGECILKSESPKTRQEKTALRAGGKRKGRPPKNRKNDPKTVEGVSSEHKNENANGSSETIKPESSPEETGSGNEKESVPSCPSKRNEKIDPKPCSPELLPKHEEGEIKDGKDCSEWTPKDVEKFFNDKGLPEAGALFREQEVDGLSLLLMKRSDVIFGLRLRLGPALKVYKLILQLQNNAST